ncbi:MAG: hypothetical protein P8Y79_11915 [Ignavibacteriaceae bacterium]
MTEIIDYIGSVVVVGIVILIVANLHFSLSAEASNNLYSTNLEYNIVGVAETFEYDLYKAGYRVEGDKIIIADSSEIKFLTDINNDGNVDSVYYRAGDVSELDSTENNNDRILYRTLNTTTNAMDYITKLKISYYDSCFKQIDYANLSNANWKSAIRGIKIQIIKETTDKINGGFIKSEWNKVINPINL